MINTTPAIFLTLFASLLYLLGCSGFAQAEDMNSSGNAESAVETKSRPANAGEWYVGAFGGDTRISDAQVTATYQCIFCSPPSVSASKNAQFSQGSVTGLCLGMWGDTFGFATEFSTSRADSMIGSDQVSVRYESITFMPTIRVPLFKTDSMPSGHLNLYAGFGISIIRTGNISVSYPELPHPVSGMPEGYGTTFMIGASWKFSRSILFVEQRVTDTSLAFSDIGDSGDVQINTT